MKNDYHSLQFGGEITTTVRAALERLIDAVHPDQGDLETGIADWHGQDDDYMDIMECCRRHDISYDFFEECSEDGCVSRGRWIFRPGMDKTDRGQWCHELVDGTRVLATTEGMQTVLDAMPSPPTERDLADAFRNLQRLQNILTSELPPLVFLPDK